jgi:hypothetical protein
MQNEGIGTTKGIASLYKYKPIRPGMWVFYCLDRIEKTFIYKKAMRIKLKLKINGH